MAVEQDPAQRPSAPDAERRCPTCGKAVSATARFCESCGCRLDLNPAPQEPVTGMFALPAWPEERKIATVLFADIVGFTAISSRLEPDQVREFANRCFEPLTQEITRRGGTVIKYIGDCIMAVFGVPRSAADDPRRALLAALAMTSRLAEVSDSIEKEYGAPISMRIGLNSGLVMVGTIGSGSNAAVDVMGSAVNLASRIQGVARPGEVVIGRSLFRQARKHFELEPMGSFTLKGIAEQIPIFTVVGLLSENAATQPMGPRDIESPFVLREAEFERLKAAIAAVANEGRLRVIALIGEPGLGQSRLLSEFRAYLESVPGAFEVLTTDGPTGTGASAPLRPLVHLLRQHCGIRSDEPPARVRERIAAAVAKAWSATRTQDVLGAASTLAEFAAPSSGRATDPAFARDQAFRAFIAWVEQLAARRPVCLLLRNMQWADEATLDFLDRAIQVSRHLRMLLVVAARPELEDRRAGWPPFAERMELPPLPSARVRQFVDHILRRVPTVPESVRDDLVARSEGNPECAREFVRLLLDRGAIVLPESGAPGEWHVEQLGQMDLPETIQGVLQARLDRLPPPEKDALKRAAVIGRIFWRGAMDALTPPAQRTALPGLLASLEGRGMIRGRATSLDGELEYSFHTKGLRDIAYRLLPRQAREPAHRSVAGWLEQRGWLREGGHAEVAVHLEAGGAPEAAVDHFVEAARQAASLYANRDAARFYQRALDLWADPSRLAARAAVGRELAKVLANLGRVDEALTALDAAEKQTRGSGSEPVEPLLAGVEFDRGLVLIEGGRAEEALAALDRGVELMRGQPACVLQMSLLAHRAFLRADRGDGAGAAQDCEDGMRLGERAAEWGTDWQLAMALLTNTSGALLMHAGRLDQAEILFRRRLELSESARDLRGRMLALNNLGAISFERKNFRDAERHFGEALAIARKTDRLKDLAVCLNNLGQALLAAGDPARAVEKLAESRRLADETGVADVLADATRALAEALLAAGDPAQALSEALDALEHARRAGVSAFEAAAHAVAFRCLMAGASPPDGRPGPLAARDHLQAATRLLRAAGREGDARALETQARNSARLARDSGALSERSTAGDGADPAGRRGR